MKNGQYQDAGTKLDDAQASFPLCGAVMRMPTDLIRDVHFHLVSRWRANYIAKGNLDSALTKVNVAIEIRPEDKEAGELRDKIQITIDKAEVEQHRQKAESDIAAENHRDAIDEIVKTYEILDKPSNATWSASSKTTMDKLANTLIGKLHEQATKLSDNRQYEDAKKTGAARTPLPSRDDKLSQLLKEIEKREDDPKTANISGRWVAPNGLECQLTDDGTIISASKQ